MDTLEPRIRPIDPTDLPALAELNDTAVPAVNALGVQGLVAHVPRCALALTADVSGRPAALLLALAPEAGYASENYQWFAQHRPGSLYVDRVVVAEEARGQGLGRALYAAVVARARTLGLREVTCEVNLDPPNPRSLAFHTALGFRPVGQQRTTGGTILVQMLAKQVPAA